MSQPFKSLAPGFVRTIELDYFPPLVNPLSVDAGPNQEVTDTFIAALTGTVGGPTSQDATVLWTLVSGPGSASFGTPDALSTSVNVTEAGVYVFKLTATVDQWSQDDTTTIQFNGNLSVDAGPDQTIDVVLEGTLSGTYAPVEATVEWTKISGPGSVFFDSATSAITNFSVSSFGTYVFRLTVTLGGISIYDETEIVFDSNLSVNAGPDQSIEGSLTASLAGSFTPPSATVLWTQQSGPGTSLFVDDTDETTDVTVSVEGTYVFRLTATVPGASAYDEVTVDFLPNPSAGLACSSESGTATLRGFVELTAPSLPPKKYRVGTISGNPRFCFKAPCPTINPNACAAAVFLGNVTFDAVTGVKTLNNPRKEDYVTANTNDCATVHNAPGDQFFVNADFFGAGNNEDIPTVIDLTVNATFPPTINTFQLYKEWTYGAGVCFFNAYFWEGASRIDLTDEDTEVDAMARASVSSGSSCTAQIEPRGAGDFVFDFVAVAYDINCSDLVAGHNYIATVDLVEETYGGGSPVTTQQNYPFTASGTTETISDAIVCPSGKQVTVQNVSIAFA